jgi:hypothetical protein
MYDASDTRDGGPAGTVTDREYDMIGLQCPHGVTDIDIDIPPGTIICAVHLGRVRRSPNSQLKNLRVALQEVGQFTSCSQMLTEKGVEEA